MTLIVTGPRRSGKTTALRSLAEDTPKPGVVGILSTQEPHRVGRSAIIARDIASDESWLLADLLPSGGNDAAHLLEIGPYRFDAAGFARANTIIAGGAADAKRTVIVDEVGPLELDRRTGFWPALLALLRSSAPVIATVRPSLISRFVELCSDYGRGVPAVVAIDSTPLEERTGTLLGALRELDALREENGP